MEHANHCGWRTTPGGVLDVFDGAGGLSVQRAAQHGLRALRDVAVRVLGVVEAHRGHLVQHRAAHPNLLGLFVGLQIEQSRRDGGALTPRPRCAAPGCTPVLYL